MAAKQLPGMPTIQSAVGILLGTFSVIGKKGGSSKQIDRGLNSVQCAASSRLSVICFSRFAGIILIVIFVRLSYQNPKQPSKTSQERVPLKTSI